MRRSPYSGTAPVALLLLTVALASPAAAEPMSTDGLSRVIMEADASKNVGWMAILTLLSFLPALFLVTGPFVRIIMTLSVLRNGLGLQQSPPNQVLVGLALLLSLFVMGPTYSEVTKTAVEPYLEDRIGFKEALQRGQEPLRAFMLRNSRAEELALASRLYSGEIPPNREDLPFVVIACGFLLSELWAALVISVLILVPFLLIDMFIASILMSAGMIMVPPILVSMPFKLVVFLMAGGWGLVVDILVRSFR